MNSNTSSITAPAELTGLATQVDTLAAQDPDGLSDAALAEQVLVLRRLIDQLEGHWLHQLAALDGRGAAGADQGVQAPSTAGWLRARLRLGAAAATSWVRTARALFRGPLVQTAAALTEGAISPVHAAVLAAGTHHLPGQVAADAEPVLVEAAGRLDPARLRRAVAHLLVVADPDGEQDRTEQRHGHRGLWVASTLEGMVALEGLLEPEAGQTLLAALEPLSRPASAEDDRSAGQRRADALTELARRQLEAGRLPQTGGVRPQLLVTVDLDSLLGRVGAVGGDGGWTGSLDPEACRRLACDSAVIRVLVARHPSDQQPGTNKPTTTQNCDGNQDLGSQLRAAMMLLAPGPGWGTDPAAGSGPDQPGRPARPAGRPGRPRRRLCVPGL
jgi:Domain of unknown function (DUF222)